MPEPQYADGKICYLEIPTDDIERSKAFYTSVFNWKTRTRSDGSVAFDDTVGQVSGSWRLDRKPATDVGLVLYMMVDDIEITMKKIVDAGGKIVQEVGGDAPEITARFTDLYGNVFGLYQQPV